MKRQIIAVISIVGALMSYFSLWGVVQWTGHNQGNLIIMPFNVITITWWTTANLLVATGATFTAILAVMALIEHFPKSVTKEDLEPIKTSIDSLQKYFLTMDAALASHHDRRKPQASSAKRAADVASNGGSQQ